MKPLRTRLDEARRRLGISWEVLERDYLLSWVLAGLCRVKPLQTSLVFKGGTALKKCYFGDYRFSEDLDFSGLPGMPTGRDMERAIAEACQAAAELVNDYAPIDITCERYTEKEPHPAKQEAFTIHARFPWQKQPTTKVMIEVSVDEPLLKPVVRREVLHQYGEALQANVLVYPLEEIIAEKLRAILQHMEKLEQRGWARSRARDYYDLWRILGAYRGHLDLSNFAGFLKAKCDVRRVGFSSGTDFFRDPMLTYVERTWTQWLGPLVPKLPSFSTVIDELRPQIEALIQDSNANLRLRS